MFLEELFVLKSSQELPRWPTQWHIHCNVVPSWCICHEADAISRVTSSEVCSVTGVWMTSLEPKGVPRTDEENTRWDMSWGQERIHGSVESDRDIWNFRRDQGGQPYPEREQRSQWIQPLSLWSFREQGEKKAVKDAIMVFCLRYLFQIFCGRKTLSLMPFVLDFTTLDNSWGKKTGRLWPHCLVFLVC